MKEEVVEEKTAEVIEEEEIAEGGETVERRRPSERDELVTGLSFNVRSRKFKQQPPLSKVKEIR
mgnify:CR=1 FL=1